MPMLTMSVMVSPVAPRQAPPRTCSEKTRIFSSTALTSGMTSAPSTRTGRPERLRKRGVQDRPVLGDVDLRAFEHLGAPAFDVGRAGEVEQEPHGLLASTRFLE